MRPGRLPAQLAAAGRRHARRAEAACRASPRRAPGGWSSSPAGAASAARSAPRPPGVRQATIFGQADPRAGRRRACRRPSWASTWSARHPGLPAEPAWKTSSSPSPRSAGRQLKALRQCGPMTQGHGSPRPADGSARWRARRCSTSSATRTTLFFALFIPVVQLIMLGFAIDTNVRHVRTMVYDQARHAGEPASCSSGSRTPRTSRSSARSSPTRT